SIILLSKTCFAQTHYHLMGDWYYSKAVTLQGVPTFKSFNYQEIIFTGKHWAKLKQNASSEFVTSEFEVKDNILRFYLTNTNLDPVFKINKITIDELILEDENGLHIFNRILNKARDNGATLLLLRNDTIVTFQKKVSPPTFNGNLFDYLSAKLSHLSSDSVYFISAKLNISKDGSLQKITELTQKPNIDFADTIKKTLMASSNKWMPARMGKEKIRLSVVITFPIYSTQMQGVNSKNFLERLNVEMENANTLIKNGDYNQALKIYDSFEIAFESRLNYTILDKTKISVDMYHGYITILLAKVDLLILLGRKIEACKTFNKTKTVSFLNSDISVRKNPCD
ncbi:MAG: hypothetical protein MUF68_03250, partial [Cyclobacteriaceae bacterium]|nr:hypothetical protein [Cyclobacteriaceae bacterium]